MTLSVPPHRRQVSMSMANTRFRRCIQVMPAALGALCTSFARTPWPRPDGVTAARNALPGAKTPWYLVRCARGNGGPAHVAAESLELAARIRFDADSSVQRKARVFGNALAALVVALRREAT
jgi:hypothetical protein